MITKPVPDDCVFLPDKLPEVESFALRYERNLVRLWLVDKKSVVVAELTMSPEFGWEMASNIVTVADKAAGMK